MYRCAHRFMAGGGAKSGFKQETAPSRPASRMEPSPYNVWVEGFSVVPKRNGLGLRVMC